MIVQYLLSSFADMPCCYPVKFNACLVSLLAALRNCTEKIETYIPEKQTCNFFEEIYASILFFVILKRAAPKRIASPFTISSQSMLLSLPDLTSCLDLISLALAVSLSLLQVLQLPWLLLHFLLLFFLPLLPL